jgi:cell division GTPase FtsZ
MGTVDKRDENPRRRQKSAVFEAVPKTLAQKGRISNAQQAILNFQGRSIHALLQCSALNIFEIRPESHCCRRAYGS